MNAPPFFSVDCISRTDWEEDFQNHLEEEWVPSDYLEKLTLLQWLYIGPPNGLRDDLLNKLCCLSGEPGTATFFDVYVCSCMCLCLCRSV